LSAKAALSAPASSSALSQVEQQQQIEDLTRQLRAYEETNQNLIQQLQIAQQAARKVAHLQSIEASSEDDEYTLSTTPMESPRSPQSDFESAPPAPPEKSMEMKILEETVTAAESLLAGVELDLHSAQEQCHALQLQLDEKGRLAGKTEKRLREEVARLQKELVQSEAVIAHRLREAAEAERERAESGLETLINARSRLENELAEAELQKIKMEKSLSAELDGGTAAFKDEKDQIAATEERLQILRSDITMQAKQMMAAQQDVIALQQKEEMHIEREREAKASAERAQHQYGQEMLRLQAEHADLLEQQKHQQEAFAKQQAKFEAKVSAAAAKSKALAVKAAEAAAVAARSKAKAVAPQNASYLKATVEAKGGGEGKVDELRIKAEEKSATEKAKQLETVNGRLMETEDRVKVLEKEPKAGSKTAAAGGVGAESSAKEKIVLEKKLADAVKRLTKEIEALKAKEKRAVDAAESVSAQVLELEKAAKIAAFELDKVTKELAEMRIAAKEGEKSRAAVAALEAELRELKVKLAEVEAGYKKEVTLRKQLHNIIEDMKGKIRVYCRVRPFNKMERERGSVCATFFPDDVTIEVQTSRDKKTFMFDQCFQPHSTQENVFEETQNLIQSAIDGYNVCIFTYGQTGAGKTHTMYGNIEMPGIAPRAMSELFRLVEENRQTLQTKVRCYMVELYNDSLVDLLKAKRDDEKPLVIKQDAKGIVFVQGATIQDCATLDDLIRFQQYGDSQRHVAATNMNAASSRSHLIFSILVEAKNIATGVASVGKITLVDLAGSERAGKTGATGDRLKEAQHINTSLSALVNVIGCLSSGEKFVPYRNNKLTTLLQVMFFLSTVSVILMLTSFAGRPRRQCQNSHVCQRVTV
jgi:hypothetical protein